MKTLKYATSYSINKSMPLLNPMNWGLFSGSCWSFKVVFIFFLAHAINDKIYIKSATFF